MTENKEDQPAELTEDALMVVQLTKAIFAKDIDEAFRVLGRYLDKHKLNVSADVIKEYELAGRIKDA